MAQAPEPASAPVSDGKIFIGSYVLESLTTGMYVEPRDALREYVQNAFDAIEYARQSRLLRQDEGTITILVSDQETGSITIRDDGFSIGPDLVWETLTSIGASRKSPKRQAGFRGIGRLAGIAYCERLEFICKAASFTEEVTVVYDCAAIRTALAEAEAADLESVFLSHVSLTRRDGLEADLHYTTVRLIDTSAGPEVLRDLSEIARYLRSVSPVAFADGFGDLADQVRLSAAANNFDVPTVNLVFGADEDSVDPLFKPYSKTVVANGKASPVRKILFFEGGEISGARWWGWHGDTALFGMINDPDIAGIRVRVKNIQLDGTEILSRVMRGSSMSKERFQFWLLGEIHIETQPGVLIPNARRDGFEDSPAWRALERQIRAAVEPVMAAAYKESSKRNSKKFKNVKETAEREISEIEAILTTPDEIAAPSKGVSQRIRAAQQKLEKLDLTDYSDEEQLEIRKASAALRTLAERADITLAAPATSRPATPPPEPTYPDFLDAVFDVLSNLLDTRLFARAKKALIKRFT
jgi:molecular chaperone HtpG